MKTEQEERKVGREKRMSETFVPVHGEKIQQSVKSDKTHHHHHHHTRRSK